MYIGIATSKSSALSINVPLIFEMQLINGALFLEEITLIRFLVSLATSFVALTAAVLAEFQHFQSKFCVFVMTNSNKS